MSYRPYAAIIAEASSSASGIKFDLKNDSGSAISALQPVSTDVFGKAKAVDVSVESDALKVVGIAGSSIPNGSYGSIYSHGKVENITTSYDFGDYIYVSKTGGLTNILPSEGVDGFVSGDFIIRVGIIVRNRVTPSQKDLVINIGIIGQV
jgi:hypothetical protein